MVSEIRPGRDFKDQGHSDKVKDQTKVISLHCTPTPLTNVPINNQLPTPYSFCDMAQKNIKSQDDYGNVKGQIKFTP